MASPCTSERFFFTVKHFPTVIDERLNIMAFVEASLDLVAIVGTYYFFLNLRVMFLVSLYLTCFFFSERLGKIFTPVTVDMQGNIEVSTIFIMIYAFME